MHCLLLYDIVDDRIRARVADACLDYGLQRIQYSAFCGALASVYQRELMALIRRRVEQHACTIHMLALDDGCWTNRRTISQGAQDD